MYSKSLATCLDVLFELGLSIWRTNAPISQNAGEAIASYTRIVDS